MALSAAVTPASTVTVVLPKWFHTPDLCSGEISPDIPLHHRPCLRSHSCPRCHGYRHVACLSCWTICLRSRVLSEGRRTREINRPSRIIRRPKRLIICAVRLSGIGHDECGDYSAALSAYERAVRLCRSAGDLSANLDTCELSLGLCLRKLGRNTEAIAALEHALACFDNCGQLRGKSTCWAILLAPMKILVNSP